MSARLLTRLKKAVLVAVLFSPMGLVQASPADRYPESMLYSKPVKVTDNIWSAIGATQYYSYENGGHNNNLSFIVGEDAVLVVNGGAAYLLAQALHAEIRKVTDKPVLYVVDENGQSHAALGNSYWKEQGAKIIAHEDAATEIEQHGVEGLEELGNILKEQIQGTELVEIDTLFADQLELDLGGLKVKLIHFGPAHSMGDISVVVPDRNVLIAGDMAFHQRMLPVFPDTDTAAWLDTWHSRFAPYAKDMIIVPGHGDVTDFATVDRYTRGYLEYIRVRVAELLENDGSLEDAYEIDQSPYAQLETFDQLAAKNAGRIFEAMEFE
ncbi:MBL fold metallo-hydrolase [Amphritea balenae]|uniref:MBL fold metallo-hydrolase n=1 Tax=Amphritea balenae TaxID=452629 RepID=UPI0016655C7B|nr:MBL fold metallo-hydrolase [Amphritea balenae]GGK57605.1 MBL fold metallo-hydrolase [Amphritea balenae]